MATRIDRVESRLKLKPRRSPYWQRHAKGRQIGFRRMSASSAGTWLARFFDGQTYPQKPLGDFIDLPEGQRFDAARVAAEQWFQHMARGGTTGSVSVQGACEAYVEHLKMESSQAAADDAKGRFTRLVYSDPLGRIDLQKLAPRHFADWKKRVLAKGGTRGSFNRNATALRAALNLAHARRDVESDHAWVKELKRFKDADGRRELYLKRPARLKLLNNATPEGQRFIRSLLLVPFRPGEVAKLKVEHFIASQRALSIPKGKTKQRYVALSGEAIAHFTQCAKDKLPGAWLISRDDGSQWDRFSWRNEINAAVAIAKLPTETCAYTLRHCVITDMIVAGHDLFTVAKISGTSIVMIEKNYGHLQREHAKDALEELALG